MKIGHFLWGILLLLFSITISAQDSVSFNDLEPQAIQQPRNLVVFLETIPNDLTEKQSQFLLATAYQKLGELYKVDSLITTLFEQQFGVTDSSLYIKSLALRSEQFRLTSNLKEALIELNKVIEYYERTRDTVNLVNTYISLSELYITSADYGFSKQSILKAEDLISSYSKGKLKRSLAILYDVKVNLHHSPEFPESEEYYALKSLKIAREIKDNHLIATACNQLGVFYFKQAPPDPRSEVYLKESIALWDAIDYDVYWLNGVTNLARYYGRVFRNQEALGLLLDAKGKVENASFEWGIGQYYDVLGKIYAKLGDYETAYLFKRKATTLSYRDGVEKYKQRLSIYTFKLEAKEKEEEILKAQQKIDLAELELKSEQNQKRTLYLLLFAALIITILAFYSRRRISNQNKRLAVQKEKLAQNQIIISKNNEQLKELIQQREALLHEVNHRVKNNLTVLSSLLFLQSEAIDSPEAKIALDDSQLRVHSISLIHESLYQRDDMEKVDFHDYILNLFKHIEGIYKVQGKEVILELDLKHFQPELKESVPIGMIVNELITNSFKYAFSEVKSPKISITHANNQIVYTDNGPGYVPKESSSSIGLQLISIFAIQLKAKITHQKEEGAMKTIIQLP